MNRSSWTRNAAATGLDFAVLIAAATVIAEVKDIELAGDLVDATNEVFGTISVLIGVASVCLWWFSGTLAARMRQLEGGSGRLAAAVNTSGAFIAGGLALTVGCVFAARNYDAPDLGTLATGIMDGPTLLFPAAVYVGASGVVGIRARGLPAYSRVLARLSVPLAASYLVFAGLQIFKYYAWINETAHITLIVWVALVSIIGIIRWTEMDGREPEPEAVARFAPEPEPEPEPGTEEIAPPPKPRPARKPPARKKPAPRKTTRKV